MLPYKNSIDCAIKIWHYEGSMKYHSNLGSFFSGGQAYWARLLVICYASQFLLDWYHGRQMVSEFW